MLSLAKSQLHPAWGLSLSFPHPSAADDVPSDQV